MCEELDLPELRAQTVCAWAGNRFSCLLDKAGMWLTDEEAEAVVATPRLQACYMMIHVKKN